MGNKAFLYWDTVKYLTPTQAWHQLLARMPGDRGKRIFQGIQTLPVPKAREISIAIPQLDCGQAYLQRFCIESLRENEVSLLHEKHCISGWHVPQASHLWNYNLHYLEFLIPLAVKSQGAPQSWYFSKWKEILLSWMSQQGSDSYEPYTISMRLPNILICMELLAGEIKGTALESQIYASVYRQYRYLLRSMERSLLGNHYFENLKTAVICSILFKEDSIYRKNFRRFLRQAEEQILPDGVHFERSLMYHKIILEDMLRVVTVLLSVKSKDAQKLAPVIQKMAQALEGLERGFCETPLFNDAGDNTAKGSKELLAAARKACHALGQQVDFQGGAFYQDAGYYKLYDDKNKIAVLFDCGEIGPRYMAGHSHCDCLSFELSAGGRKIFSNSGTGQYQGKLRPFFRSTAAHNTVMADNREQSQLWGEHRAGRRIKRVGCKTHLAGSNRQASPGGRLTGRFVSYQGDAFQRSLELREGKLVITDSLRVRGKGTHTARQFFHLVPGLHYRQDGRQVKVMDGGKEIASILMPKGTCAAIHTEGLLSNYAKDFGEYGHKEVLEVMARLQAKARIQIVIKIGT